MDTSKQEKMVSLYHSGLLSASEVANTFLRDVVLEPAIDTQFLSSLTALPDEVRVAFLSLLLKIKRANYHWKPFVLACSEADRPPETEYSLTLRQICDFLQIP